MKDTGAAGPLRVLVAHNAYQQRGGEDAVVEAEVALLRAHGHAVHEYRRSNDDADRLSKPALAAQTVWSTRTVADMARLFESFRPDVLHVHNTCPLISPSVYWAADRASVPVVQTLHNFRLICPQAMLLRNGKVCEDCVGKLPWRGVARRCYRGSVAQSGVLAGMLTLHRAAGTWRDKVARYVALNGFCRDKFIQGGLPAAKLVVKPNFIDLPAFEAGPRAGFLFVGRLSEEKGIKVLAEALERAGKIMTRIVGAGPEQRRIDGLAGAQWLGAIGAEAVYRHMRSSQALIMPSIWYENFPRTLVEAFACGLPVIASRIGALPQLVAEGTTGLLFEPGNAADLASKLAWAHAHPERMAEMGVNARTEYEAKLTGAANYKILIDVYTQAESERRTSERRTPGP